jgi:hypothetical protein
MDKAALDRWITDNGEDTTVDYTTTDLAKFGWREKKIAAQLLTAMIDQGLPDNFHDDEVTVMLNNGGGCVFLTNSDFQVVMLNGGKLEEWHSCPECGHEGFAEDMQHDGSAGCEKYLRDIGLSVEEEAVAAD